MLRELSGLAVAPKTVERHAEALGREVARDECGVIDPEPCEAPTLYLGLDGTGVPARPTEVEGREGKQPDGRAKTREAKLAVVWSAQTTDPHDRPVRDPGSATYNAAIESIATRDTDTEPAPFAKRILRETEAPPLRQRTAPSHPRRRRAVDLELRRRTLPRRRPDRRPLPRQEPSVRGAAKAIYGHGSEIGEQWARKQREALDEGRVDDVTAALRSHADTCEEARKNAEYFSTNRERMNYQTFRAMGLCVASGVVEGGCKHIVGALLKQGGMRWSVNGANAIIALRCAVESNRFDDFWERRASAKS